MPDQELTESIFEKLRKLTALAKEEDLSLSQLSLAWALDKPQISSLITGASKPEQVIENAAASDLHLSQDLIKQIEDIMDNEPQHHRIYDFVNYRKFVRGGLS